MQVSKSCQATSAIYQTALVAWRNGINILPIVGDGSKRPSVKWERYQQERVTLCDLERWFLSHQGYPGIAFVTGAVSQGLELLDFDDPEIYQVWLEQMHDRGLALLAERIAGGYLEASPQGMHLLYRCRIVDGNQKLAGRKPESGGRYKTLIETRGEGGLVIVAPSAGGVHRSGKPYQLLQGGPTTIQLVTVPERAMLLDVARSLDELPLPEVWRPRPSFAPYLLDRYGEESELPGHIFNQRASWEEVLTPHGWSLLNEQDGEGYWTKHADTHATTNYRGNNLFYVFSTATIFQPRVGYSKFAAYTLLNYGCLDDMTFASAARELARQGYTNRPVRISHY